MFTSAADVLKQTQSRRDRSAAGDASTSASTSKRRQNGFDSTTFEEAAVKREAAKRARIARGEDKKANSKSKPKQSSIYDAFGAAMAKAMDGGRRRRGSYGGKEAEDAAAMRGSFSALPGELIQRVLTYAPVKFYSDARLVCKAWRDAIDDDMFMPATKIDRSIALGTSRRPNAIAWFEDVVGADWKDPGIGPLVRYIARTPPFKSELSVDKLCDGIQRDRLLSGAYEEGDGETVATSFLGTIGDVVGTIRDLAAFECVKLDVAGHRGVSGWGVLALAMVHVAENEFVGSRILRAARSALRGNAEAEFVEEDLTEFMHLLIAYIRLGTLEGTREELSKDAIHERRRIKARLTAAFDYADLHDERDWSGAAPGLNGMPGALQSNSRLTIEQEAIVATNLKAPHWMIVHAFAGSGKTTTLVEYARRNPHLRFLYLAFNRAIADEARSKFPPNTECKTFHSLAYPLAVWYKRGGKKMHYGDKLRTHEVAKHVGKSKSDPVLGKALVTLKNFMISAAEEIGVAHVPEQLGRCSASDVVDCAKLVWDSMKSREADSVPLSHAGYMKMYQLQHPRLDIDTSLNRKKLGFDILLLDEAQDVGPVMFDIVFRQENCAKILVGDSHQQIYNFTGAMNILDNIGKRVPSHLLTHRRLVRSFRFGPEIAMMANRILDIKRESALVVGAKESFPDRKCIFSAKKLEQNIPLLHISSNFIGNREEKREQVTILVRTNASLVLALFQILSTKDNWPQIARYHSPRVSIVGGAESLKLDQVLDFVRLINGDYAEIKDKYIRSFISRASDPDRHPLEIITSIAESQDDFETLSRIEIAKRHGDNIGFLLHRLQQADVHGNEQLADFVLSTAHKSKGLEWDNVVIWSDFQSLSCAWFSGNKHTCLTPSEGAGAFFEMNELGEAVKIDPDEINLVYVAITRARKRVFLTQDLTRLLSFPQTEMHAEIFARMPDLQAAPYVLRKVSCKATTAGDPHSLSTRSQDGTTPVENGTSCHFCPEGLDSKTPLVWHRDDAGVEGLACVSHRDVWQKIHHQPPKQEDLQDVPLHERRKSQLSEESRHLTHADESFSALCTSSNLFRSRMCAECFRADPSAYLNNRYRRSAGNLAPLRATLTYEHELGKSHRRPTGGASP